MPSQTRSPRSGRQTERGFSSRWVRADDEAILDVRMCDLCLDFEKTPLVDRIERLYGELESRRVRFRPRAWLSEEWFSPDGVPGIGIPFYLAHERLMRLEKRQMLEVEGGSEAWCLRILRHEAGHAIDTAYRLDRRRKWREIFGNSSKPYPVSYKPRPHSKTFVVHLGQWYAQSHPSEDFAETFAVWLAPRSRWRKEYQGWQALKKLQYVDELMEEIGSSPPRVRSRCRVDPLSRIRKTLRAHYDDKRAYYDMDLPGIYDRFLRRIFKPCTNGAVPGERPTAASYLRGNRRRLREEVARRTGAIAYTVDQVVAEMIDGCREHRLRLRWADSRTRKELLDLLTEQTWKLLRNGSQSIPL